MNHNSKYHPGRSGRSRWKTTTLLQSLLLLTLLTKTTISLKQSYPLLSPSTALLPLQTQKPSVEKPNQIILQATTPTPLPINLHRNQKLLEKRWSGYTTMTVFVNTVTVNLASAPVLTVTINPSDPNPNSGTVTITVGAYTQTVNQPVGQYPQTTSTQTIYLTGSPPPTTIRTTSVVTVNGSPTPTTSTVYVGSPTSSATSSNTPWFGGSGSQDGLPADRPCYPGEENERVPGHLKPTSPTQTSTLFTIALYFVVCMICWNLILIRHIIFPAKIVVVCWHEFGHVVGASCSGTKVESVSVDPNEGGATRMEIPPATALSLPLGYISSCLIGGLLIFCSFNTLASKIASFFVFISLVIAFWFSTGLVSRIWALCVLGFSIGLWFIDHAGILRYYILFYGVLSSSYVIYDMADDFVFRKMNPCCPAIFFLRYPQISAGQWGMIWTFYSALSFIAWILLALVVWRQTPRAMFCQSQQFLPT